MVLGAWSCPELFLIAREVPISADLRVVDCSLWASGSVSVCLLCVHQSDCTLNSGTTAAL